MADVLNMAFINSLPLPILGRDLGKGDWWWPVNDFEVSSGMCRIDVCGLLEVRWTTDFSLFRDGDGVDHDPDTFFADEPLSTPDALKGGAK
jgi:hypothetical protein